MRKPFRTQRVRDPVHGLIVFSEDGDDSRRDQFAWKLLNTSEFQRLRRIRQLGVSELTFPGATHTRFAHSIGVFHTARMLVALLKRNMKASDFNDDKANVAVLAALLHDIGHGPFSHAFESVQNARGAEKRHEQWTAEIILDRDGQVWPILDEFRSGIAQQIADLLSAENPQDEYHAIVSSSFDADRLDYLRRDRLMTGTGAGAIDFDWLIDNIRLAEVPMSSDDEEDGPTFKTFCLDEKAIQAAESFLLARYHLFEQVYLHKTTRGAEAMLRELIRIIANAAADRNPRSIGLDGQDPFIRFFGPKGGKIRNYLALDDHGAWTSFARVAQGPDREGAVLAQRLLDRRLYKPIDINTRIPIKTNETQVELDARRQGEMARIERIFGAVLGKAVFRDSEPINIYGEVGADEAKRHKKLSIRLSNGTTREITELSPIIRTLVGKRNIVRYYCDNEDTRKRALKGGNDDTA